MRPEDRSVLKKIEADGGMVPRLKLRETGEEPASAIQTGMLRETGRYEIVGEIARGGVGHILKGHDVDLGRDVALKVLRDDHRGNRELVQRLVEEAQVGGQLQHPGVVPVYELGIAENGRPYFSMKLVKGETLASLLSARADPTAEGRRFLVVFEQVCRTVAYAHSRGVVHRDLKPSNIMIGPFGEVQVVDWGFAKVLAHGGIADEKRAGQAERDITLIATARSGAEGSESIPGSIMGTPAYMPPEQALGRTDDLDERSDVFSLGAILCEILTGLPPYTGETADLLTMAAQGLLEDAYRRLDACGADPELVALVKQCLAPLRKDRPRDAGALAEAVSGHLAALEERARRSEVGAIEAREASAKARAEAAELRAKAEAQRGKAEAQRAKAEEARRRAEEARAASEEARRARRQSLGIAAAILAALVVGVGGYAWFDQMRQKSARAAIRAVNEELRQATRSSEAGEWEAAVAAGERAVEIARTADAPAAVLAEAKSQLGRVEATKAEVEQDRAMRDRLESGFLDAAPDYASALRDYGMGLEGLSPKEAGTVIRGSRIPGDLVQALDDWATRSEGVRERLVAIAGEVDVDPVRRRIRQAMIEGDAEPLVEMVKKGAAELPARTVVLLGEALMLLDERYRARWALEDGWVEHPDDFRLNCLLARALESLDPPVWGRAATHWSAAFALRPERTALRDAAEKAIDEVISKIPDVDDLLAK